MKAMQNKVLGDISKVITAAGLEAIPCYRWANMGHVSIQHADEVGEIGSVRFNFQDETMTFGITIQGVELLSQPPRPRYHDFHMKFTEIEDYRYFRQRLATAIAELAMVAA